MESYSTRDVARLLRLSEAEVRSQARAGFLKPERGPRNSYRFSFQDIVLLRTARELAGARVTPRRIRGALRKLARHLPSGRSLTELRITSDGDRVLVHEGGAAWNPESEQFQIDFGTAAWGRSGVVALCPVGSSQRSDAGHTALQWFEQGEALEDSAPIEAMEAYAQALALKPNLVDAHVNLGRLLQLEGNPRAAIGHYRQALRAKADATAAFNLGTALEQLGRWASAIESYQRAIDTDGTLADAHFNLARLCERVGQREDAIRHLREYRRLVKEV